MLSIANLTFRWKLLVVLLPLVIVPLLLVVGVVGRRSLPETPSGAGGLRNVSSRQAVVS